ncbi:KH domain-containing protein [Candidatus Saccharibacteria bacterium]|nr:KH domain-containing protein [Candidatus Saccharibacteria bacterium]
MDQQFIEYIIKSIVGHPDEVKIERRIDEKGVLLELSVNPEDLGRVIGKRGATAQSIRTLLRALGTKNDARYNLKIIDTGPPPESREQRTENKEQRAESKEQTPVAASSTADDTTADDTTVLADEEEVETKKEPKEESAQPTPEVDVSEEEDLEKIEAKTEDHSDVISRTRKELADLDDLDV